jgi:hypothetical protein
VSNLNQAIRDDLGQRARDVTPYAADHSMVTYANAIRSVLDLHTHSEAQHGMRFCAACGLVSRNSWCDTVSVIAGDLGVSSQDTPPPPRPKPRVWRDREDDRWEEGDEGHLRLAEQNGQPVTFHRPWCPRGEIESLWGPLTEVLPSVSTDPDGRDR